MRVAALLLLCVPGLPCYAVGPQPACEMESPGHDSREVSCAIPVSPQAQRFEFVVNFSGGHDDTSASMQAALDERPLGCEENSKTSLFAEDGEVSLYCRFTVAGGLQGARLKIAFRWSHAQYTSFAFARR